MWSKFYFPRLDDVLRSSGQPLDPATRAFMSPRFGYDFSNVRVHSGAFAGRSATELNSKAYTVGHNIVFGTDQYTPGTREGQRLIAHELAHVIQQAPSSLQPAGSSGNLQPSITTTRPIATGGGHSPISPGVQPAVSHLEAEATSAAEEFAQQRPVVITGRGVPMIACSPADRQEYIEDDEWYQLDRAEDIAKSQAKPKRGAGRRSAVTPGSVSREAEREVAQMLADATAGKYQSSAIKTKGQLVAKFRRLLGLYRVNETMSIEQELTVGTLSANQRRALVSRKRSIVVDRNYLQGKFDEAVRTPRGAMLETCGSADASVSSVRSGGEDVPSR